MDETIEHLDFRPMSAIVKNDQLSVADRASNWSR